MSSDDNSEPYWLDEDDWLVTICPLPKDEDDPEVNLETLNWIGRLFGFATATSKIGSMHELMAVSPTVRICPLDEILHRFFLISVS
jgi:hypothetical protein